MRRLIGLAAVACAASVSAADSSRYEVRDAADLVAICSVPAADQHYANAIGFCHGVLTGAYRYYEATVAAPKRFVCAPTPTPTRTKVMNDFVAWSHSNPAAMKGPPLDALFRYLSATYPCRTSDQR